MRIIKLLKWIKRILKFGALIAAAGALLALYACMTGDAGADIAGDGRGAGENAGIGAGIGADVGGAVGQTVGQAVGELIENGIRAATDGAAGGVTGEGDAGDTAGGDAGDGDAGGSGGSGETGEIGGTGEAGAGNGKTITFLITGIDNVGNNSDVIMLASLNTADNTLKAVQIPRDSYINDEKYPFHKINAVYSFGYNRAKKGGASEREAIRAGNLELASLLERIGAPKIDCFASVGTEGFVKIVDSVGGVDVETPAALDYDDEKQDLHIHFPAGINHLDGRAAERFIRFRSGYVNADYGRMDAQKLLLFALVAKIKTELSLPQTVSLIKEVFSEITTDMPLLSLVSLAPAVARVQLSDVEMITLKGRSVTVGGVMYEAQNRKYTLDVFNKYLLPVHADIDMIDPEGIFDNPSVEKIHTYYTDNAPYSTGSFNAADTDRLKNSIPIK